MAYQIVLHFFPLFTGPGEESEFTLTARVYDSATQDPVPEVEVRFTSPLADITFGQPIAVTDSSGQAQTLVGYVALGLEPVLIPVTATTDGGSTSGVFNIYNRDLSLISLTNVTINQDTGAAPIDGQAIAKGIQARIILPADTPPDSLITLYWGDLALEKAFTGSLVWVIDIKTAFGNPAQVLANGRYSVWYSIQDAAGNGVGAFPLVVTVTGSPYSDPVLLAPTLPPELYNRINLAAAQAGVVVTVAGGQSLLSGNPQRSLFLTKRRFSGTYLSNELILRGRPTDANLPWEVPVPEGMFLNYNGIYGDFYYTATVSNVEYASFITRTIIDTVPP